MELRCDTILFDMDGTLVDSTECVERQWRLWAGRHDLELEPILAVSHGRTTLETIRMVAPQLATVEEVQLFDVAETEDTDGIKALQKRYGKSRLLLWEWDSVACCFVDSGV